MTQLDMFADVAWWWISTPSATVAVRAVDGIIREGPPIVRKLISHPIETLTRRANTTAIKMEY